MVVGFLLSFIVPSTTARVACLMPIMMGFVLAFKVDRKSRFAALLVITTAQTASIWNVGIKTAAAQNMVAIGFIEKQLGAQITWGEWFVAAAPFAALMTVALFFIMTRMMEPEMKEIAGGQETIRQQLAELGPMTLNQWKLLAVVLVLLGFWSTEKVLHNFDTTSTTIAAVALMLFPRIGVMDWKQSQKGFPWGTVVLFAVGISVGSALLQTKAAGWLAQLIVSNLGLQMASAFVILMLLSAFLIVIHLGFASATALASTMIPIVISVLSTVQTPGINIVGMTMILQFVVSFGFILPVNAPQNMIAYGTDTFEARDFVRTGIVITLAAVVLLVVFALTYWPWLGLMVTAPDAPHHRSAFFHLPQRAGGRPLTKPASCCACTSQALRSGGGLLHQRGILLGHLVKLRYGFAHLAQARGLFAGGSADLANDRGHLLHRLDNLAHGAARSVNQLGTFVHLPHAVADEAHRSPWPPWPSAAPGCAPRWPPRQSPGLAHRPAPLQPPHSVPGYWSGTQYRQSRW